MIHSQQVLDPYRWLEDAKSKETQEWMNAQDTYARAHLAKLPGIEMLHQRLRELSYVETMTAPLKRGKLVFFESRLPDKEKPIWYWRTLQGGKPHILIDPNALHAGANISVSGVTVSWDGRYAAFKVHNNAADAATLKVVEVETGTVSEIDTIDGARLANPSWTPTGDGFYYTREPSGPHVQETDLPGSHEVYFHRIGTDPRQDTLIHPKTGYPDKFLHPQLSHDGRFLFLYVYSGWASNDIFFKDMRRRSPPSNFKPLVVGRKAHFFVCAHKDWFYVMTDDGKPRERVFKVHPDHPQRARWREIVPEQSDAVLSDFAIVGEHLSLQYLKLASTELRIVDLEGKWVRRIVFPTIGTASNLVGTPDDDTAYYSFASYVMPSTIFRTSVRDGGRTVSFRTKVPIDAKSYLLEQVFYPSQDGTRVSMFIVRPKHRVLDGTLPFLLYGYGGFRRSITPDFVPFWFAWLEQGGGLAITNLRGGGEYGDDWHREGMLTKKQNVFDDFIGAATYLIEKRYTSADRLALRGGSNAGLLVGAAMTQRPELFRVAVCSVPLLDMVRYHLFGSARSWISEYGSAKDPTQFNALFQYSPYHRVKSNTAYPALLMMSADSDDRVDSMHARKFTAAIQHATSSDHPVLLLIKRKAGHCGGAALKQNVNTDAIELAFLLHEVGLTPHPALGSCR